MMVQCSTETRDGWIETRHDDILHHEAFSYEEMTELLILVAERRSKKVKLPLRKSLFPHVAPYIIFQPHNREGFSFPKEISKHLRWELGSGTPWIVRKTVEKTGYRVVFGTENWSGTWSDCRYSFSYKILTPDQKMNHFPGTYEIGHKDRLWKNISRLMSVFGRREFAFVPRTFVLPQELAELRQAWGSQNPRKWIIKPPASSRGRGISVVNRWTKIPKKRSLTLVQRYLSRPKLINGCKFDLRVYALVTDFHPLKIYVHSEGLVRFACERYQVSGDNLSNKFMHLTNYSVNKFSASYEDNDTVDEPKGHKWSLNCLWDYLKDEEVDVRKLRAKIHDVIIKAIICAEPSVNCFSRVYMNSKHNCYELFGFDILIDEDVKPWLLEVNISPSLHTSSVLDVGVKGRLVRDVLNLAGYRVPGTVPPEIIRKMAGYCGVDTVCQDVRADEKELGVKEKRKQMLFMYHKSRDRGDCSPDHILDQLTPDDVRRLVQYEDELVRLGQFQKVFPTPDTRKYLRFFEAPRYYNILLSEWENQNGIDRAKGIKKLQDLCAKKYHLR